jgi:hypothetical protein
MPPVRRAAAVAVLAAAVLAPLVLGCEESQRKDPLVIKAVAGNPQRTNLPMFQVRIVRLLNRVRPDAPLAGVWDLLGAAAVPHEKQALWEANDLRLGRGGEEAIARLNNLLTNTADREAYVYTVAVRENMDFVVTFGSDRPTIDVLWSGSDGSLSGRHFEGAQVQFRVVCRGDPADPQAVALAIVPEVVSGKEMLHWIEGPQGFSQQVSRSIFTLQELAAEARLAPGEVLVVGGRASSPVSLGGAMFYEHRGPDLWVQTVVFQAQRLPAGAGLGQASQPGRPSPSP